MFTKYNYLLRYKKREEVVAEVGAREVLSRCFMIHNRKPEVN